MTEFLSKTAVFVTDWFTLVEKRFADSPSSAPYFARLSNRLWCFFAIVRPSADVWHKEADLEVLTIPRPIILQSIATGKPMLIHSHCLAAIGLAVMQGRIDTIAKVTQ
jgi:hypothetical protein